MVSAPAVMRLTTGAASRPPGAACRHVWVLSGARPCPMGNARCSQSTHACRDCDATDNGEPGGPADRECSRCRWRPPGA